MNVEKEDAADYCGKEDIEDCNSQEKNVAEAGPVSCGKQSEDLPEHMVKSDFDVAACNGKDLSDIIAREFVAAARSMNDGCYEAYKEGCEGRDRPQNRCSREKTLLKCSTPATVTVPIATCAGTTFSVAPLALDTSQFCNPCIYFEFASNIVTAGAVLSIDFQILKQCEDQIVPIAVSPIWRYSSILPVTASDTFSFGVCKCNECREKCCNYSVRVTVMGAATAGITSIKNMTLSALVVEKECNNR